VQLSFFLMVLKFSERIVITELQPEGKNKMDVKSFLAGHKLITGNIFTKQPSPITTL